MVSEDMTYVSHSETDTRGLAHDFSKRVVGGEVVALYGGLGSGKTNFVKGFCRNFNVDDQVSSPTFVLMNIYQRDSINLIHHFDFYRITSRAELNELGLNEYLSDNNCISLIEWPERVIEWIPLPFWEVHLKLLDEFSREISVRRRR